MTNASPPEGLAVFIVDDDASVRDSLAALLESAGFETLAFESARAFLASDAVGRRGCLVADVRMPDMDGLELQEELVRRGIRLPIVIVTGHADVPLAVRAMKAGAIEFLEKPYNEDALIDSVRRGLSEASAQAEETLSRNVAAARLARLTEREREVYELLILGHPNKVVAHKLDISPRTVEIHRAHVMEKMEARNLAQLIRMSLAADEG
jgi:two-component system response regulator FixJ